MPCHVDIFAAKLKVTNHLKRKNKHVLTMPTLSIICKNTFFVYYFLNIFKMRIKCRIEKVSTSNNMTTMVGWLVGFLWHKIQNGHADQTRNKIKQTVKGDTRKIELK